MPSASACASLQAAMRRARSTSSGQHFPRPDSSTSPVRIHRGTVRGTSPSPCRRAGRGTIAVVWRCGSAPFRAIATRREWSAELSCRHGARPVAESEVVPELMSLAALSTASSHHRHHAYRSSASRRTSRGSNRAAAEKDLLWTAMTSESSPGTTSKSRVETWLAVIGSQSRSRCQLTTSSPSPY